MFPGWGGGCLLRTKIRGTLGCDQAFPDPLEQAFLGCQGGFKDLQVSAQKASSPAAHSSVESPNARWGIHNRAAAGPGPISQASAGRLDTALQSELGSPDGGGLTAEALRSRHPGFREAKAGTQVAGATSPASRRLQTETGAQRG